MFYKKTGIFYHNFTQNYFFYLTSHVSFYLKYVNEVIILYLHFAMFTIQHKYKKQKSSLTNNCLKNKINRQKYLSMKKINKIYLFIMIRQYFVNI